MTLTIHDGVNRIVRLQKYECIQQSEKFLKLPLVLVAIIWFGCRLITVKTKIAIILPQFGFAKGFWDYMELLIFRVLII